MEPLDHSTLYGEQWTLSNRALIDDYSVQVLALEESHHKGTLGRRGIDRIAIGATLHPDTVVIDAFLGRLLNGRQWEGRISIPGLPFIHGSWTWNSRAWNYLLRLEFNPSDFFREHGIELCPFGLISDVCQYVLKAVIAFADPEARYGFQVKEITGEKSADFPEDWKKHVYVQVLDLAQDFVVDDKRFLLDDLKYLRPKWKRGLANFLGNKLVETVSHPAGTDSAVLKIYDKHAERAANPKSRVPLIEKGHTRFEVHIPSAILRETNLFKLDDLSEGRLNQTLGEYWEASNWSTPLVSKIQLLQSMREGGLSDEEAGLVFTYLYFKEKNQELPLPERKIRKIRRMAKRLNMRISEGLEQSGYTYGYFDFEAQSFVVTVPDSVSV
jgi:hypothetical protein